MQPNNHSSAPCRIYLHPAVLSNPALVEAISFRTGLTVVVGDNPAAPSLVEPRKTYTWERRPGQEFIDAESLLDLMSFGSFIRRLASPAFSTKQTQPKDPGNGGWIDPTDPGNGGGRAA